MIIIINMAAFFFYYDGSGVLHRHFRVVSLWFSPTLQWQIYLQFSIFHKIKKLPIWLTCFLFLLFFPMNERLHQITNRKLDVENKTSSFTRRFHFSIWLSKTEMNNSSINTNKRSIIERFWSASNPIGWNWINA